MSDCYLILDQGGQSSRAMVINAEGVTLAHDAIAVATRTPAEGRVEQAPDELLASLHNAARNVLAKLAPADRDRLHSAALVTQRSSLLCWHKASRAPLTPVLSWQDRRAQDWLSQLKLDAHWLRRHTGLYPNAHYGASKMRWCLQQVPAVQQAFSDNNLCCGPLAAFLASALVDDGQAKLDPANAQRTALYNIQTGQWDDELLQLFDIPRPVLPALVPTAHAFGDLHVSGRRIALQLLNGDQAAAVYARGWPEGGTASVNLGTGAFISTPWQSEDVPEALLHSVVYAPPAGQAEFVMEGTVNGAGSALQWARKQLGLTDIRGLDQWAEQVRDLPLFINAVGGLGSPFWCANLQSAFVEARAGQVSSAEQKMVAVLESVLFLVYCNVQLMQAHGAHLKALMVSGGLSRLDSACQKLADLTHLPVRQAEDPEASARGAAFLLQAQRALPGAPWQSPVSRTFRPGSRDQAAINRRFARWRELLAGCLQLAAD